MPRKAGSNHAPPRRQSRPPQQLRRPHAAQPAGRDRTVSTAPGRLIHYAVYGLLLGLCLTALAASAETLRSGPWVVRYSVINSMQIPPRVADDNDIERRSNRAIITITLQRPTEDKPLNAVPAHVTGKARTLLGERYRLDFRRVKAAGSVYSLAAVPLPESRQTVTFELVIETTDGSRLIPLEFTRTLYRRQ